MILFFLIPVIHLVQPVATWILEKLGRNSTTKELIDEIDAQLKGKLLFGCSRLLSYSGHFK